jgi:SAM-dependent methyltransferase
MQDPLPRAEELGAFYPPVYSFTLELGQGSRFKKFLSGLEYKFFFAPQYRAQVKAVMRGCGWQTGQGKKLLDIGCGRGLRLLEFRKLGFEVHGLDLQPDVVRYLNEELKIPAQTADVSAMVDLYEPASFDLITTYYLIEHIPNVREAIANMYSLLKPGGWLAAAVPFVDSIQSKIFGRQWINVREAPRHLGLPTRKGMALAYQAAGFQNIRVLPDSAINCAGQIASSTIPGSTLTHFYGSKSFLPFFLRGIGAGVMVASIPFCLTENYVLKRPSLGVVLAQKPTTAE